jgi:hypothetical protein
VQSHGKLVKKAAGEHVKLRLHARFFDFESAAARSTQIFPGRLAKPQRRFS